ncbi:MAG: diguanylate cyclase [Parcubacteria group bacterium]|nr:diguanylate cyclase [Parcubacteria group bacterium]
MANRELSADRRYMHRIEPESLAGKNLSPVEKLLETRLAAANLQIEAIRKNRDELVEENAALKKQVEQFGYDSLTGLPNKKQFLEKLQGMLTGLRPGDELVLFYFDIDKFKQVNDGHGHDEGDRLLSELGAVIQQLQTKFYRGSLGHKNPLFHTGEGGRRQDDLSIVGRQYGDEFVAAVKNFPNPHEAAQKIRNSVRRHRFRKIPGFRLTVSVGGVITRTYVPAEDLIKAADAKLYEAKGAGRNTVVICNY